MSRERSGHQKLASRDLLTGLRNLDKANYKLGPKVYEPDGEPRSRIEAEARPRSDPDSWGRACCPTSYPPKLGRLALEFSRPTA